MKKRSIYTIILFFILMIGLSLSTFAEVGPAFYFDGNDPEYQQFLKDRSLPEQASRSFARWMRINKYFGGKEEDFNINDVSLDFSKGVWITHGWTKEMLAEFFDVQDKASYLHHKKDVEKDRTLSHYIHIPVYYQGVFDKYGYANVYFYEQSLGEYKEGSNPMIEELTDIIVEERLLARFKEWGLEGYIPQHTVSANGLTFVLCQNQGQNIAVYVPSSTLVTYFPEYDERLSRQRTFTKNQLVAVIEEYENFLAQRRAKNEPIRATGGTMDLSEDEGPAVSPWLWVGIGGGAVALALIVLIIVLAVKKKKVNT